MANKATKDIMDALHGALATSLTERIVSGEATAAELAVAAKFLKDNGIEADALSNPAVQSLAHNFPTFEQEDANAKPN